MNSEVVLQEKGALFIDSIRDGQNFWDNRPIAAPLMPVLKTALPAIVHWLWGVPMLICGD